MWRSAVRAETAEDELLATVSGQFDMEQFYEHIDWELVYAKAKKHGYSLQLLRVSLLL